MQKENTELKAFIGEKGIINQSIQDSIEDGIVYEIAFEGNDSDAEFLEKKTGLTLLGVSDQEFSKKRTCIVTGNSTVNRCYIARMY